MEPSEFGDMVKSIRNVEHALGTIKYDITERERNKRRSLYAKKNISKGDIFTADNVGSYRPGYGLSPRYWDELLGKVSMREINKGDILTVDDLK